jgi:hypothetical protein
VEDSEENSENIPAVVTATQVPTATELREKRAEYYGVAESYALSPVLSSSSVVSTSTTETTTAKSTVPLTAATSVAVSSYTDSYAQYEEPPIANTTNTTTLATNDGYQEDVPLEQPQLHQAQQQQPPLPQTVPHTPEVYDDVAAAIARSQYESSITDNNSNNTTNINNSGSNLGGSGNHSLSDFNARFQAVTDRIRSFDGGHVTFDEKIKANQGMS